LIHSFAAAGTGLRKPQGALVQVTDGTLYGTAANGGADGFGGIFRLDTNGASYAVVRSFSASGGDGRQPVAGLTFGSDGRLYGVTQYGGGSANGSVFRLAVDGTGYEKLHGFTGGADGAQPVGTLVRGPDGALYGMARAGGAWNHGTVFRVAQAAVPLALSYEMSGADPVLTWPASAAGAQVQGNTDVADPGGWTTITEGVVLTSDMYRMVLTKDGPQKFFRLFQP
jgi:uncharacterized repeat protein (TIGR03803 family)